MWCVWHIQGHHPLASVSALYAGVQGRGAVISTRVALCWYGVLACASARDVASCAPTSVSQPTEQFRRVSLRGEDYANVILQVLHKRNAVVLQDRFDNLGAEVASLSGEDALVVGAGILVHLVHRHVYSLPHFVHGCKRKPPGFARGLSLPARYFAARLRGSGFGACAAA